MGALFPVCCQAENLLANSGFENGSGTTFDVWGKWDGAGRESWAGRTNEWGLAFYGWTIGGGAYQDVNVRGRSNYTFSAYGFNDSNFATYGAQMKLEFYGANGLMVGGISQVVTGSPAWQLFSITATSPSATYSVRPVLLFGGPGGSGGAFKWDDAVLNSTVVPTNTHFVSLSGSHTYPYTNWATAATGIQAAVDAAENGEFVLIGDGIYSNTTTISVSREVELQGLNGASNTIVDGGGFYLHVSGITLRGLTIRNGAVGGVMSSIGGTTVRDCIIRDNRGGGLKCNSGDRILHCEVMNNRMEAGASQDGYYGRNGEGGGLYCSGAVLVADCVITGNLARGGYAIYSGGDGAGAGIYAINGAVITNCFISGNTAAGASSSRSIGAGCGGGIFIRDSVVENCRIVDNTATSPRDGSVFGAGIYGNTGARVENCVVTGNRCTNQAAYPYLSRGGGVYGGSFSRCRIENNEAIDGGGAYGSQLVGCSMMSNRAAMGGACSESHLANCTAMANAPGLAGGSASNCIVYYNTTNYAGTVMQYCCTVPMPVDGTNNFSDPPGVASLSNPHLVSGSPCINAGLNAASAGAMDLDGEVRTNGFAVDVGCDEFHAEGMTGAVSVAFTIDKPAVVLAEDIDVHLAAQIDGKVLGYKWAVDGQVLSAIEPFLATSLTGPANHILTLAVSNLDGTVTATTVLYMATGVACVAPSGNATPPYTNWATAATNIQQAIDIMYLRQGSVLVTDGVYEAGGVWMGGHSNRIAITHPMIVRSVNGPSSTVIRGQGPMGSAAVRCAYVSASNVVLSGFTLTNGYTSLERNSSSHPYTDGLGGGVLFCGGGYRGGVLSNCVVVDNHAIDDGGGVYGGVLYDSIIVANDAGDIGGGSAWSELHGCVLRQNHAALGGGAAAYYSHVDLYKCQIISNVAISGGGVAFAGVHESLVIGNVATASDGGGGYWGAFSDCLVIGNTAATRGGGTYQGHLYNCTVVGNSAGNEGGGCFGNPSSHNNTILVGNIASSNANYTPGDLLDHSCTYPLPSSGTGNIASDPLFVNPTADDFHLSAGSPCIDTGINVVDITNDLDGIPRPLDGNGDGVTAWDMGAYEFVHPTADSDGDNLSDQSELDTSHTNPTKRDSDDDQMSDEGELVAGTDPNNAGSLFVTESRTSSDALGYVVSWQGVTGRFYSVHSATHLTGSWNATSYTDVPGINGTMSYTNEIGDVPLCFRVRVRYQAP